MLLQIIQSLNKVYLNFIFLKNKFFYKMTDISKQLSINFYNKYIKDIYGVILEENKKLYEFFQILENKNFKGPEIVALPLIMISGGEAINLYSLPDSIKPTKDSDLKLLVPGKYSLPIDFKKNYMNVDLKLKNTFKDNNIASIYVWKQYLKKEINVKVDEGFEIIYSDLDEFDKKNNFELGFHKKVYQIILETRKSFFSKILKIFKNISLNNNTFLFSKNFKGLPMDLLKNFNNIEYFLQNLSKIDNNSYIVEENIITIPFYIIIPRISVAYKNDKINNFPFYIDFGTDENTQKASSSKKFKNDFIGFINELKNIESQIIDYLKLSENEENNILNLYFSLTSLKRKRALTTLSCVKIIIIYDNGDLTFKFDDEGFIDLWTEFSCQYTETKAKKRYDARIETGDIPCILERVNDSFLKFPLINWLIRDQVRMLIHGLRKESPYGEDWNEDTTLFTPAEIDPLKYCDKITGMLEAYDMVIEMIQNKIVEQNGTQYLSDIFNPCRSIFDYIACSPDAFISWVIRNYVNREYWDSRLK